MNPAKSTPSSVLFTPALPASALDAGSRVLYTTPSGYTNCYAVPSFLIIGAQKCGTRELHTWLDAHPRLRGAPLECHFFNDVNDLDQEWPRYCLTPGFLLSRGRHGDPTVDLMTFEKTPAYLDQFNGGVPIPELVSRLMPNGRFVAILRDPVERAYSSYRMGLCPQWSEGALYDEQQTDFERLCSEHLERMESDLTERLIRIGHYADHLGRWIRTFSRDQIFVVLQETFIAEPEVTMARLLDFLGVDPFDYSPLIRRTQRGLPVLVDLPSKGRRAAHPPMPAGARHTLQAHYKPHVQGLKVLFPQLQAQIDRHWPWAQS